jgi:hypothetical protein
VAAVDNVASNQNSGKITSSIQCNVISVLALGHTSSLHLMTNASNKPQTECLVSSIMLAQTPRALQFCE